MIFSDIKLITFDLDDTLWPCMPTIVYAENVLHDWLKVNAPKLAGKHDVTSMREHRKTVSQANPDIAYNLTLTRRLSLESLLSDFGYAPEIALDAVEVFQDARNRVLPYDDVSEVLEILAPHFHLVSVTNGNAQVHETPLKGHFDHSLTAEFVGAAKPNPHIFKEAMRLTETLTEQTLHIGDDPHTGIYAAQQAGIRSIWVNRNDMPWPKEFEQANATITSLDELPDLLEFPKAE